MKTRITAFLASALFLNLVSVHAQTGGMDAPRRGPQGPQISASMAKLFGENSAFSATMESQMKLSGAAQPMVMPGEIAYDSGKSRFEMNMSDARGSQMPPQAAAQMKSMGLDRMVTISRPDRNTAYIIYPDLKAYAEMPIKESDTEKADTNFKIETTEVGKETVEGHACVKNKVIVTNPQGEKHESTVWNATDLKNFPIKMETIERGQPTTVVFKNVKLSKPDAGLFDTPSDYKKYNSVQELTQTEVMKKMGGGMGMPPKQ